MKHIQRLQWFSITMLLGVQTLFPGLGMAADNPRNLTIASTGLGTRVAIVVGNSAYPNGALTNPKNDASAMAGALKKLGFDTQLVLNASKGDLDKALKQFSHKTEKADVALLFYAGHGIQVNGNNYIVPIDANPQSERDLKREMVKMDDVIDDMGGAKVKLIFFDACRDNPLSRSFSRGGSRGMAAPVEATGTLISFATKHGNTAADGDGRHSPYTQALLEEMDSPNGMEIEQMLRKVQQGVKQSTKGQQEPWRYGSLDGDFYFKAPAPQVDARLLAEEAARQKEQAARDRAELLQSIEKLRQEKDASDRAMQEAAKKASAQAARERTELQQSMEKMLTDALARQRAMIEAERAAQRAASGAPPVPSTPASTQVASISPAMSNQGSPRPADRLSGALPSGAVGDEWEYRSQDLFGKTTKIVERITAIAPRGALEEFFVDGASIGSMAFDGEPYLVSLPLNSAVLFSPFWDGTNVSSIALINGATCNKDWTCSNVRAKVLGTEKIKVPAGAFNTQKLQLFMNIQPVNYPFPMVVEIVAWYSGEHKRLIKQTVFLRTQHQFMIDETIELMAFRAGASR